MTAIGPTLPPSAVQQVGSYLTYTGRDANVVVAGRVTRGYGISTLPRRALLRLDVGRADHLAPLLGFGGDKLPELGGRKHFQVLQAAAPLEPELDALWQEISQRRAANMRLFAMNLAETGCLRTGLSVPMAADIIWSMNSPEFFVLLTAQRGWSPEEFEHWLADAWIRLLLEP